MFKFYSEDLFVGFKSNVIVMSLCQFFLKNKINTFIFKKQLQSALPAFPSKICLPSCWLLTRFDYSKVLAKRKKNISYMIFNSNYQGI